MSKKAKLALTLSAACVLIQPAATAQDKSLEGSVRTAESEKVALLMRDKLNASKMLLEGVTTENFELIKLSLIDLKRIAGETAWQNTENENFRGYSASFKNAVEDMEDNLKAEKSIKSIALPFVRINLSCLECHEMVRKPIKSKREK